MDEPVTRAEFDALRLEVEHLAALIEYLYRAIGPSARSTIAAQIDACREDRRRRRERAGAS